MTSIKQGPTKKFEGQTNSLKDQDIHFLVDVNASPTISSKGAIKNHVIPCF
jgi:hypothetical protein